MTSELQVEPLCGEVDRAGWSRYRSGCCGVCSRTALIKVDTVRYRQTRVVPRSSLPLAPVRWVRVFLFPFSGKESVMVAHIEHKVGGNVPVASTSQLFKYTLYSFPLQLCGQLVPVTWALY